MATGNVSARSVNEAMRKVSKGPDLRQEMALVAGVDANWEEFLVPGPVCVAILGDLMLIATSSDFELDKNPPKDGFKLLNHPKSFRACLMQVGNAGYDAFNMAHKNMDQIRLRSSNVTGQVKQAVEILLRGRDEELEGMLSIPMAAIQETATKCLTLAQQVEQKFAFVMDLTAELLEACVSAEGGYEKDLKQTEVALRIAKDNKTRTIEREQLAKKNAEELKKAVKTSENAYNKAMDSMPSGWETIGMNFVEGITTGFTDLMSGFRSKLTKSMDRPKPSKAKGPKREVIDDDTIEAYSLSDRIATFVDGLVSTLCSGEDLNVKALADSNTMTYCRKQLESVQSDARSLKGIVKDRLSQLCQQGIQLCKQMEEASVQFQSLKSAKTKELASKLLTLQGDIRSLSSEGKMRLGSAPTDLKPPNQAAYNSGENLSAAQHAVQNARFKIEETSAHLKMKQDQYDKACDKVDESSQKLRELIDEMKQLEFQTHDLDQIKATLVKEIKVLGELREKWGKVVMFFQMISNIIDCSLNTSLKGFLEFANVTRDQTLSGYQITNLKRDMIYQQAFEAAKIAHLVTMISSSYVEVSNAHLMDKIAGLGKLLGYDPVKEIHLIKRERQKLFKGCEDAQDAIRDLVIKRKREFDAQINARMQAVKRELESVLPPIQDGGVSQQRIEQSMKKAVEAAKNAESKEEKLPLSDKLSSHYSDI